MTIRNEAMISRYFDRMMSPGEEQNFLISLAASNELRLAFRSQLELMKAIRDDKHDMRPIAEVRSRTLMALGLTGAVTAPFLEQALLHEDAQAATAIAPPPSASFFSRLSGKFLIAGSGLAAGFLAATLFFGQTPNVSVKSPVIVAPATQSQVSAPPVPAASAPEQQIVTTPKEASRVKAHGQIRATSAIAVTNVKDTAASATDRPKHTSGGGALIKTTNEHRDSLSK